MDTGTIMEQVKVQIAVANAQELLQVNEWETDAKLTRLAMCVRTHLLVLS